MPDIDVGLSPTQLRAVDDERMCRLEDLEKGSELRQLRDRLAAAERERDDARLKLRGVGR